MTLDPASSEINFEYSIRRYLMEQLGSPSIHKLDFLFDQGLSPPTEQTGKDTWVAVNLGVVSRVNSLNYHAVNMYACARNEVNSSEVSALSDLIKGVFTDGTVQSQHGTVTFYSAEDIENPVELTKMSTTIQFESGHDLAIDGTKFKQLTVQFMWAANI